jgi:phenylalanyl-tRNA synthetase beta chain
MQISLKWINELVNIKIVNLDDLIEKLTLGGFEVEEILEVEIDNQKQMALDISATANRSDSLSIQGISTEIAALLNKTINISTYSIKFENLKQRILKNAKILPPDQDCIILSSVIVENLIDKTVPKWITQKLISSGITPAHNLIDFQTYILLETGYPFAFYDFDKINSKLNHLKFNLSISNAKNNQEFIATNNNKYNLDDSILLIKANEIPISIAGIIENQEFSYSDSTTSLLIEGSIFSAAKIRQQSRNLGLKTDRSRRYEKSLKSTYFIESFYRLISLLRIANPNLNCKLHTINKKIDQTPKPILLRYETICEILGPISELSMGNFEYINPKNIENYLNRLNFTFVYDEIKEVWEVQIPHSRTEDITREIDLIEEIGRLHGFNNFLITLPKLKTIGTEDASYKTRKKITCCLLNLGFNELIHYSLVNEKTFFTNEIKLINPLVSEYSSLRVSLLPNLIKTVHENLKQGNSVINGFEYGHIFLADQAIKFKEKEYVAGIFGGLKTKLTWSDSEKALTWFEAKGKLEQLFNQLNISVNWQDSSDTIFSNLFHPYRKAELYLTNNIKLGIFGQIHPILANKLNLPSEIYLFEFNIEVIQNQMQMNKLTMYKEYSSYPKIVKDISFIIQRDITFKELQEIVYYNGTKFLSEINLLDEYMGKSIPDQHKSLCLQLIFQSNEKTLQNKEIEEILNNIRLVLTKKFNALIRN